jgi:hypothetical protein
MKPEMRKKIADKSIPAKNILFLPHISAAFPATRITTYDP